jgi:hypothetical protein
MSKANRAGYASWAVGLALCGGSACRGSDTSSIRPGGADPGEGASPAEYQVSTKNDVQWKRHAALEADLSRALELDPAALCSELGQANCIRQVHLVPLGGNDPFDTGILQPSAEPLATTPAIIDRVLLSACGQRAALDRDAPQGQGVVFKALDMNGAMPDPRDARVSATITELYQRLLARNPTADELATVAELARDADQRPLAAFDFARLSCFAIGGSTENLFY